MPRKVNQRTKTMSNSIQHPVKVGSKTNIGTIKSYKYVRYGFSKYRYFTLEGKHSYGQDEITEIYETK